MAAPQEFAAQFSRTLELFRDHAAKEEQKAQFRALASLLKSEGAIILAQDGRITVNGAPVNGNTLLQRSEEHTSELQSHSFISYAVFCLKKKTQQPITLS